MKIAVCFSGHMRTFDKTFESVRRHLLDLYDSQVFIHTWENFGTSRPEDVGGENRLDTSAVYAAYKPTMLLVEKPKTFETGDYPCFVTARTSPHNVISKWYSAQTCFNGMKLMSEQFGEKFDVVVSMRPDMLLHENVTLSDEKDVIFVPGNIRVPEQCIHDYFAFGDMKVMESYFATYDNFHEVCSKLAWFRPEAVLTGHAIINKLPLKYCKIEYSLARLNGELRRC